MSTISRLASRKLFRNAAMIAMLAPLLLAACAQPAPPPPAPAPVAPAPAPVPPARG